MKTFFNGMVLLMFITILTSCNTKQKDASTFPYDQEFLLAQVGQVNALRETSPERIGYAFHGRGKIESRQIEEVIDDKKYQYLSLEYVGNRVDEDHATVVFDMGLEVAEIPFPNFIANASVTFLRDQLLVRDLDTDFAINFWSPSTDDAFNRLPKVNTEHVPSLRIRTPD